MNFTDYKQRTYNAFREARSVYKDAYTKLHEAEQELKQAQRECPSTGAHSLEAEKKLYRAKAKHSEALQEWQGAKNAFERFDREFALIDKEVTSLIASATAVNPADVDANALELLKSGIMSASDYKEMASRFSDNRTMKRLIGKYADERAEHAENADERINLHRIGLEANHNSLESEWNDFKDVVNGASSYGRRGHYVGVQVASPEVIIGMADKFEAYVGIEG